MNEQPFGLGAHESPYDPRTWQHPLDQAAPLPQSVGTVYAPTDIENQHKVGICTAIALVQNAEKALGKKFSPDFQYLLQKKFVDLDWSEGSSIFTALNVGKKYGFLPDGLFSITEADRNLPYSQYIAKLQAVPDTEVQRLIGLCTNKLSGYAQVPVDTASLIKGIQDSKSGILCRYSVGDEWWTPSWNPKDIDPLRHPEIVVSGHAIGKTYYDSGLFMLANTWGTLWDRQGNAYVNPETYSCTEAWIPYYDALPPFSFTKNLWLGMNNTDVQQLQIRLGVKPTSGFFGPLTFSAVRAYQTAHGISPTGFVGPLTRASLNG